MEKFIPQKQEKEVISIRLFSDLLKRIDDCAGKANLSRNEFINQCISFALAHIELDEKNKA